MALSYRKYQPENLKGQLVTSNLIDPNKILGRNQGKNGFANLIICIAEAWYLESVRELANNNRSFIIDKWQESYFGQKGEPWCEIFTAFVIGEAIKLCGVANLYPQSSTKVGLYADNNNKIPAYNWVLSNDEITKNGLRQYQDVVFASAFRSKTFIDTNSGLKASVGRVNEPVPGSKFYRYSEGNSSGHTGIVIAVLDGYFYTIEGNVVIDNNNSDEGVGMYRYPLSAAQNSQTGFEFYDFSNYPSRNGNNCESRDFTYTYVGLDGKQKTRNCYKPPVTPPKDIVEVPPTDKPPVEKPPVDTPPPPVKKDCVPADLKLTSSDTPAVRQKKCEEFITVGIPSKDLVQNYNEMKNPLVSRDITKSDLKSFTQGITTDKFGNKNPLGFIETKLTANEISQRNGSALWYGPQSGRNIDTKKSTGFGMFKDKIGNIIFVLDANNQESEQLAVAGLLGFEIPNIYLSQPNNSGVRQIQKPLGQILYKHRSLCNLFMIGDIKGQDYTQTLRTGIAETIQRGVYQYGNGFYNSNGAWKFEELPNNALTQPNAEYGLDFQNDLYGNEEFTGANGRVWKYSVPYANIKDSGSTKDINIYKLLQYVEDKQWKLSKPIIILVDKVMPPPPIISQDFISILKIAGGLTALVGIPLPMDAILGAVNFASNLEAGATNGFSTGVSLLQTAFNVAKGVVPDEIKGLEADAKKLISDNVGVLEEQLKEFGSTITQSQVFNELKRQVSEKGDIYQYGKYAVAGFDGLKNIGSAAGIIGLNQNQINSISKYYSNITAGGIGVFDMRDIVPGFNFKEVQKNIANLSAQITSKTILNQLNQIGATTLLNNIKNAGSVTDIPIMQEIILNGGASTVFGMLPKAPELATSFVNSRISKLENASIETRGKLQDQRANLIAAGMGYNLEICDIFRKETTDSLVNQATVYAREKIPFFLPPTINPDEAECYKYEIIKTVKGADVINCPEGWNYDVKTNRCFNETTKVGFDTGIKINTGGNISFDTGVKVEKGIPKCIQSSFGTYVFYFRGIPLAAMESKDGRWIASWGGKNYFIDVDNCTLLGLPGETTEKPTDIPTTSAIALPKCITIRNGKYYYDLKYASGLNDGVPNFEQIFGGPPQIYGQNPLELAKKGENVLNMFGVDTSKVTNDPIITSTGQKIDLISNLLNNPNPTTQILSSSSANPILTLNKDNVNPVLNTNPLLVSSSSSNPILTLNKDNVSPIVDTNPIFTDIKILNNPNPVNVTMQGEEEAFYMNGKWYLLRNGKYVEIIDCLPKKSEVYKCGIIERDGEYIYTQNGAEYKAVRNFDNDFYVFINGSYYQLDANCNPIIPKPSGKECTECEILVEKEKQNRIKLEKSFSESKVSNDSKIKELMNLLNTQTQKSLELERQMILRSGDSTAGNDSKYNELLSQLQSERERVNQLSRLIQQSETGGNNYDSIIREIITSLNQEKERSQNLEQKIAELEKTKTENSNNSNSTGYFTNLNNVSKDKDYGFEKEKSEKVEALPNCITSENGKYYFTGTVGTEKIQLIALNTAKGWVAKYIESYYMIDLTNCNLLTGSSKKETNFTGECTDCVQNTQPRIIERNERITYGGFKQGYAPEVYEDCEEC